MPDLNSDKLLLFVLFVTPGLVAIKTYSLWCPGHKADWGSAIFEAITYSVFNLLIWHWWVYPLAHTPYGELSFLQISLSGLVVCFLSPVIMAGILVWLRKTVLHRWLNMDHPTPRGWEYHLSRNREFWVLFHLKSGKSIGGRFSARSFAATYPQDPEIYVQEIYRVDGCGRNWELIPGTLGMVVRLGECERLEFFEIGANDAGQKNESVDGAAREGAGGEKGEGLAGGRTGTSCGSETDAAPRGIGNGTFSRNCETGSVV